MANLNGLNLLKGGTAVATEIEKCDVDPRIKRAIYEIANNQQTIGMRLNDCIDVIINLSNVMNELIGISERLENKMYRKEHNPELDPNNITEI